MTINFEVQSEVEDGRARLTPVGELDIATAPALLKATSAALDRHVSELALDLSHITFIDSTGLRLLITLYDESAEEGWALRLLRPAEAPRLLFRLTGLDHHLPLSEDDS